MSLTQNRNKLNKKNYFIINQIKKKPLSKVIQFKNLTLRENLTNFKLNYYWNQNFDKNRLKIFVFWCFKSYGQNKTIEILEILKHLGFQYATKAGLSLSIDDLIIPPTKSKLLIDAELTTRTAMLQYKNAQITNLERFQKIIETWHITSEKMKDDLIYNFKTTNIFNPLYMMAFSGARGNISQVRQLVGMRGLMANPQGQILDFPIQSNFREGLTLTEYVISCYGARKGVVDTALRTANAGYLTRRLVDVAQHVIISNFDCGTNRGIIISEMKQGNKLLFSLRQRLLGRVLAKDIKSGNFLIAKKNQEISDNLAEIISSAVKTVIIRSPLTCQTTQFICQLCYGWSLAEGKLVGVGETVGIIAAQSIGEPGTQLTMRTFHTGGVFAGELLDQLIAPFDGIIKYNVYIPGNMIRTPQGQIAFLTRIESQFFIESSSNCNNKKYYKIPPYTILFIRNKETVSKNQLLAQLCSFSPSFKDSSDLIEYKIFSDLEGEIRSTNLKIVKKVTEMSDIMHQSLKWGYIWILSGKIYQLPINFIDNPTDKLGLQQKNWFFPIKGDFLTNSSILSQILWINNSENIKLNFEQRTSFYQKLINNKEISVKYYNQKNFQWLKTWEKLAKKYNFKSLDRSIKIFNTNPSYASKENSLINIYSKNLLLFLTIDKMRYKKLGYFIFIKKNFKNLYILKKTKNYKDNTKQNFNIINDLILTQKNPNYFIENKFFIPMSLQSNSFVNKKNSLITVPKFYYQKLSNRFFEWFSNKNESNLINSGLIKFSEIFIFKKKFKKEVLKKNLINKKQQKNLPLKHSSNIKKKTKLLLNLINKLSNKQYNYYSVTNFFENQCFYLKQFNNKNRINYLNNNHSFILFSFYSLLQCEKQQLSSFHYINKNENSSLILIKPQILPSKQKDSNKKKKSKYNIKIRNLKKQLRNSKNFIKITIFETKKTFRFNSNLLKKNEIIILKKNNQSRLMSEMKWIIDTKLKLKRSTLNNFSNQIKNSLFKKYFSVNPKSLFYALSNSNKILVKKIFYNQLQFINFFKKSNQIDWRSVVQYNYLYTILSINFLEKNIFINDGFSQTNNKYNSNNVFFENVSNIFINFNNMPRTDKNRKTDLIYYKHLFDQFSYLNWYYIYSKNKVFRELVFINYFNKSNINNLKKFHSSFTYYIIKNQYRFAPSFQKQSINELENIYKKEINNSPPLTIYQKKFFFIKELNNCFLSYLIKKLNLNISKKNNINKMHLIKLNIDYKNTIEKLSIHQLINQIETIKKYLNKSDKNYKKLNNLIKLFKQLIQLSNFLFNSKKRKLKLFKKVEYKEKQTEKILFNKSNIIDLIYYKKIVPIILIKYKKMKITLNSKSFHNISIFNHLLIRKPFKKNPLFFNQRNSTINNKKNYYSLNIYLRKLNSLNNIIINSYFQSISFKWLQFKQGRLLKRKKKFNSIFFKRLGQSNFINKNLILSNYQSHSLEKAEKLNLSQYQQSESKQGNNFNKVIKNKVSIKSEEQLLLYSRFFLFPKEYSKISKNKLLFITSNLQKNLFVNPFYFYKIFNVKFNILADFHSLSLFQQFLYFNKISKISNEKLKFKKTLKVLTFKNFLNLKKNKNNLNVLKKNKNNHLQKIKKLTFNYFQNIYNFEFLLFNYNRQGKYIPLTFNNNYGIFKYEKKDQKIPAIQVIQKKYSPNKNLFYLSKKSKILNWELYKNNKEFLLTSQPGWICKPIQSRYFQNGSYYLIDQFLKKDLKLYNHNYINSIKSIKISYNFCEKNLTWFKYTFVKMIEFVQQLFKTYSNLENPYLFCLTVFNSSFIKYHKELKNINKKEENLIKIYKSSWFINRKSRFLKLRQSNIFFSNKSHQIDSIFFITKMHEFLINNYQNLPYFFNTNMLFLSKKKLLKIAEKNNQAHTFTHSNSLILKSQYHSIFLNKQKISQKLISTLPNLETSFEPYLGIPLNKISKILNKKSVQQYPEKNQKQINSKNLKLRNTNYKIFRSQKPLNIFRYFLRFSIPITFEFSFQSARICWNYFPNFNLAHLKFEKTIKSTESLNYLITRNKLFNIKKTTTSFNINNNYNLINLINMLNCIKMLLRQPCIDWSATQQINLGYQKDIFLATTKTVLLVSKENIFSKNHSIALTKIFSNMKGEILYSLKNKKSNSTQSNFKITDFNEFLQKNDRSLFLTKSDQICLKFKNEINNELNFFKKFNIFKNQKHIRGLKIFQIKSSKQIILIFKILQKIHNNCQFSNQSIKINLGLFIFQGDLLNTFFLDSDQDNTKIQNIGRKNQTLKIQKNATKFIIVNHSGQIIHLNKKKLTLRKGQPIFFSPHCIFHSYNNDFIEQNKPVLSLPYQQLKTGDIVQGIPKIEQLFEARLTFAGKLEYDNLTNILEILFQTYKNKLTLKLAVRRSIELVQMIIVNSIQRIYRSQGVNISDKHLEVIVKQMTKKVEIIDSGQSGFLIGEQFDLDVVELWNSRLSKIKHVKYKPLILGISKSSLQTDSFLSAASFQYTTRILSQSAFFKKRDFLKGLKENIIVGNIIPAGTGFLGNLENLFEIR
nr:RNA polymerase beta'' subunit [Oedogonium crispum]